MPEPAVMISHEILLATQPQIEAAGLRVLRRWEMTDADRAAVQAIVHIGDVVLTPDYLKSLPNLGLVACVSVGYDGVDVAWCRAHGIEVTHAQGVNAEDVADHAIGLLIGSWRNIVRGDQFVRAGKWSPGDRMPPRPSLGGRKLGIVGLGAIGEAVARRAGALRMQVSWWGPNPKDAPWPRAESLLALAQDSDVLVVANRAGASTRGMISREIIEAVGPKGLLINVSRGSVVDEDALIEALKDGRLGRAALDVFAEEPTPGDRWADLEQVVVTPHSAGGTINSIPRLVAQAIENVRLFMAGQPVNSPAIA